MYSFLVAMAHRRTYHSGSSRHDEWDYRQSAWYFITICTDQRLPYFGEVRNGIMGLSRTGCVATHYWRKIATLNDNAVLDAFVVMPNHVHGLLGLDSKQTDDNVSGVGSLDSNEPTPGSASGGSRKRSGEDDKTRMSQISPEAGSVSTMIRSYKSAVTKRVRGTLRTDFGWQRRFHDHIVRSEQAFNTIRQYIVDNPSQWRQDEHHPSQIEEKAF